MASYDEERGQIGKLPPSKNGRKSWVQTERSTHEAFNQLIAEAPTAARLMNLIIANMGQNNAVVASQTTLGELLNENLRSPSKKPVHRHTVRQAIKVLERDRWIEVVQLGGKGGSLAYVVNDRVAWGRSRKDLRYSRFSAEVLASGAEQPEVQESLPPLREIPELRRDEMQVPTGGPGIPPSQGLIEGTEPDLPSRNPKDPDAHGYWDDDEYE